MFYAVLLFRPFGRVPGTEVSCQITGDAAHTQNIFALAYRALVEDNPFVSAVVAGIYRVVDGAVAYVLIVHHLYNFGDGAYILLGFSVQFHISDVAAAGDSVERGFTSDFLHDANWFLHVNVE